MSLSVSYNRINNGIDTAALKEVTQQIFQRANAGNSSSALSGLDLTKFNRVNQGTDLYGSKVDASTASQIAMTKTGMQVNLSENALNSLRYLSSEASKSVMKNADGKISIPETKEITERQQATRVGIFGKLTETADLGSDRRGSNPFYKGELLSVNNEDEKNEITNIFA